MARLFVKSFEECYAPLLPASSHQVNVFELRSLCLCQLSFYNLSPWVLAFATTPIHHLEDNRKTSYLINIPVGYHLICLPLFCNIVFSVTICSYISCTLSVAHPTSVCGQAIPLCFLFTYFVT